MNLPTNRTQTSSSQPHGSRRIDSLFKALHAYFGTQWIDKWEGAPLDVVLAQWEAALARFDDACVKQALDSLLADGVRFAPSLPEFHERCATFRPVVNPSPLKLAGPRQPAPEGVFVKMWAQLQPKREDAGG